MSNASTGRRDLPLRIIVEAPPPNVLFALQRGRTEIVSAVRSADEDIAFDLIVQVSTRPDGLPNLLGPFTQGPPAERFIYINSGTSAGDSSSCWSRRAKVPLKGIGWEMIEEVLATPGSVLEGAIRGRSRDGGPVCASVPVGWKVGLLTVSDD